MFIKQYLKCLITRNLLSSRVSNQCIKCLSNEAKELNNDSKEESISSTSTQRKQESLPSTFDSIQTSLSGKSVTDLLKDSSVEEVDKQNSLWTTESHKFLEKRDQSLKREKLKTDPKDTCVILFPGQGSQFIGMGDAVIDAPNVSQMFSMAKNILGYDLLHICLNGPRQHLDRTQFCQPAIYVTSLSAVERLRESRPGVVESCVATAGFSVGEIASLVFAGAMTFEDGLRLVKIRAEAMQYASEMVPSGMMTLFFGADARIKFACHAAKEWCVRRGIDEEFAICSVANYLFPHCKVIAGHEEALSFIQTNAKDFGIKRIKRLPVSGAFHTKLMAPARKVLQEALKHIKIEIPLIPVHSNVDARIYRDPDEIRKKLADQITSPVRWEQIMHTLYERPREMGFPQTYECGPGSSLLTILGMVHGPARRNAHYVPV